MSTLLRKSHFLGAKFRTLRKRNGLTLQDLSARCIQLDADLAPSVSYLSMIETGQRATRRYAKRQFTWFRNQAAADQVLVAQFSESLFEKFFPKIRQFLLTLDG